MQSEDWSVLVDAQADQSLLDTYPWFCHEIAEMSGPLGQVSLCIILRSKMLVGARNVTSFVISHELTQKNPR